MKHIFNVIILGLSFSIMPVSSAKESKNIELETLKIQGNKELPKMLFIVPWKNSNKSNSKNTHQKLVLHSLYGNLFDPVTPRLDKNPIESLKLNKASK